MTVELLHSTPLWVCAKAIRRCWASEGKSDTYIDDDGQAWYDEGNGRLQSGFECGEKDKELIHRVGNKFKHASTLEHLVYTFDINGISRACLQEVARHRIASYSVKSTRYTLKELKDEAPFEVWSGNEAGISREEQARRVEKYCVFHKDAYLDDVQAVGSILTHISDMLKDGTSNDIIKYCLPEAYKTSLVMTINARSLQNFLSLRTSKSALWEIRLLAKAMYNALPEEHKYLFEDYVKEIK